MSLRVFKLRILKVTKDFLLASRILSIFSPFKKLFLFLYYFNELTRWVHKNKKESYLINDFYRPVRNYFDREKSYKAIIDHYGFDKKQIAYLEFGVSGGYSFNWWMENCKNPDSNFYGFDTFEGLPEKWGVYAKGEMNQGLPEINDKRGKYIKGIFQDSLCGFIKEHVKELETTPKIIHLDADLFSATLFVLSQMYPLLNKGDIIMFDEFNVYDHEFMAYKIFTESFYVNLKPISAQNNYLHASFVVE